MSRKRVEAFFIKATPPRIDWVHLTRREAVEDVEAGEKIIRLVPANDSELRSLRRLARAVESWRKTGETTPLIKANLAHLALTKKARK